MGLLLQFRIQFSLRLEAFLVLVVLPFLVACGNPTTVSGPSVTPQMAEVAYSATPIPYTGSLTTVTATATFNRYVDGATGLATVESAVPIRFAETHLLDASGKVIQRGETDANGAVSMIIPRASSNYTLRVNSRADNNSYKVSVLQDPYSNAYYSLDTGFSTASQPTIAVSIVSAPAVNGSSLLGGAFNIMDQVYQANVFLRANAYKADCPVCLNNFTVAPKAQIYWKAGFSPATYYNQPTTAISFFLPSYSGGVYPGLYILGGIAGDLCTDTDHFDRSVVLHEYGHFLENVFGKSASPGGAHDGNTLIDPRLAWSEGWADFFQAAVLGRNYYRDTRGNANCSAGTRVAFADFNLEDKSGTDVPAANEGIFREISIARTMYDVMTAAPLASSPQYNVTNSLNDNKTADSYSADIGFSLIWNSFTNMGNATYKFQNMGHQNLLTSTAVNANPATYGAVATPSTRAANYTSILTYERQVASLDQYGSKLTPQAGATCSYTFATGVPVADSKDNRGYVLSTDLVRTNDYYRYDYDGNPANAVITLTYARSAGSLSAYDLDLYVYNEKHTLLSSSDMAGFSETSQNVNATSGSEVVNLSGKPAGTYLINVKVYYQGTRADTTYYLETSTGVRLCP